MSLIEAIVAASVLYLSAGILNNNLREEVQAPKRIHKSSSLVSTLITFGIILGVRLFLESISHYYFLDEFYLFRYLTTDLFLFAIMTTIFLPFHSVFF